MQRFDVLDLQLNVLSYKFLEASAGTGKTFAIETLFVRWVLEGIAVKEILVVTFTKAATQELIERIHQRLQKKLVDTEDPEQRLLLEAALSSYDEAKIFTIHGFCQAMLRRFYLQSGCTLLFSNSSEVKHDALWKEWIDFLRAHVDSSKCSRMQLEEYFGNEFEKKLRALVRMWKPDITDPLPDFSEVPTLLEERLREIGSFPKSLVMEDFEHLENIYTKFTQYQEQYLIIAGWCERNSVLPEEIEKLLGGDTLFLEALGSAEKKKKQKDRPWLFPGLIEKLQQAFLPLLSDLRDKEQIARKLCSEFTAYRNRFGQTSATPDELLIAMRDALEQEEFLKAVQGQFSAAVIDEFQDTDETQWMIFSRLFMKQGQLKAFYLVGDPKQSIYSFRNADLYTYLCAKDAFQRDAIATLSVNYRSINALVEALNALFTDEQRKGWLRLPKTGQILEVPRVEAADKRVMEVLPIGSVHVVIAHEREEQLFAYIASQVQFWRRRKILPKEMAVLVKDRFEARRLIRFLNNLKIKTHYTSQGHIADTATFEALVDFFVLLEKPRDLSRLKKVLAGPLVAWTQECLTEDPMAQALFGVQLLVTTFEEKGLGVCLKAFFEEPWSGTGRISTQLLQNDRLDRYEEFEQLCELLIQEFEGENLSLMQVRLFLETLRKEKNKEGAVLEKRSSIDDEAVEITTIFQSKGLEYDIVFPLALATSEQKDEDEESIAEKMRLLYVALTRAKRCVYLPWMKRKKPTITDQFFSHWDPSLDPRNIVNILTELGQTYSITVEELHGDVNIELLEQNEIAVEVRSPTEFTRRYPQGFITSFSSMSKSEKTVMEVRPGEEILPVGVETGKFIHKLLEILFRSSWHHPYQKEKIADLIQKEAEGTVFSTITVELENLLEQVIHLKLIPQRPGKAPFTLAEVPGPSLMPELEFVYSDGGNLIKGFIDLTLLHEGQYYIIDWKTNWLPEYSPEQIQASIERSQYDLQAKIYTEALQRYVKLFDERSFEDCFGGAYYLYLRGMQWKSFMN